MIVALMLIIFVLLAVFSNFLLAIAIYALYFIGYGMVIYIDKAITLIHKKD